MIHVTNNYVSGSHRFYTVGTGTSNDNLTTLSTQPKYEILRMERSNVSITGHLIPSSCNVYDLGSSNLRFRDLYLSGNTIDLGGTRISRDDTTGGMKITSPTNQPLDFQANHLIVNGNIGIGTNVPLSQLDVRGNIVCSNISVIGDFVTLNTVTSNTEQMVIENAGTGPALKVTQTGNNSVAEFYDKESGVALFVGNGGNVGIGTTVPQASLDVRGNFYCPGCVVQVVKNARSYSVDGGSWGGYTLSSTSEVTILNPLLTITPKYSNSLIVFNVSFSGYHSINDFYTSVYIRRNNIGSANKISSCVSSANGSINWGDWTMNFSAYTNTTAHAFWNFTAWDQPNTTSTITYILTGLNHQASKSFYFWSPYGIRITAMEIAQ